MSKTLSELWVTIMNWVSDQNPGEIFRLEGLWSGQTPDWNVEVNGHKHEVEDVPPYGVRLSHREYLAFGIISPNSGVITGPTEDEIIAHFAGLLKGGDA